MAQARIGKVTYKPGIVPFPIYYPETNPQGDCLKGQIVKAAKEIADYEEGMVGYVVVGLFEDGTHSMGYYLDPDCNIGQTMMPSLIADIVRRYVLTEPIANGEI